eukprot:15364849-Ditylum_brightwellii.AAC.2
MQQSNNNNKFFAKIFEKDDRNFCFKCEELMSILVHIYQMKLLYTCISSLYCTRTINQEDRKRYITSSLEKVASSTTCCEAIAVFKQLLDKAKQDGIISGHEYYSLKGKAVVTHVGAVPFVKEIWKSICNIQTHVVALENHTDVLENNVSVLASKFQRLEQVNTKSFKLLEKGSFFQGAMGSVISNIRRGDM